MKIGILGSGTVATTLAAGFLRHGHQVMLGSGHPEKLSAFRATHATVAAGSFGDAAKFGEALVLAVKGLAALDVLRLAGEANLGDKVVMDTTNPIANAPPDHGVLKFFTTLEGSLMEQLQREFPRARFVKVFNSVGNALMVNPKLAGGPPTMFICGNDAPAKATVRGILDQFGWETDDLGDVQAARAIEPLCILWCIPGFLQNDWAHAYKVLR